MMRSTAWFHPSSPRARNHPAGWTFLFWLLILLLVILAMQSGCSSVPVQDSLAPTIHNAATGVVSVMGDEERGTGIVISRMEGQWVIVTCAHVINKPGDYWVDDFKASILGVNKENDVGVLVVRDTGQHYQVLHPAAHVKLLEHVTAVGILSAGWVFMDGHIASLSLEGNIVMNTGLQPGMSGGPVLDDAGEVVGMTDACALAWDSPNETFGFAVPASTVAWAVKHLDKPIPALRWFNFLR
jgi:S1-C subfamily serine protease